MLVDLGRNDLGRVCAPGTVRGRRVHARRALQPRHAHRLDGRRRAARRAAARSTCSPRRFPAGTLSGAPKVAGDGDHRGARADPARAVRRHASATSTSAATWTWRSRSAPRCCATAGPTSRPAPGSSPTPTRRRGAGEPEQGRGRAARHRGRRDAASARARSGLGAGAVRALRTWSGVQSHEPERRASTRTSAVGVPATAGGLAAPPLASAPARVLARGRGCAVHVRDASAGCSAAGRGWLAGGGLGAAGRRPWRGDRASASARDVDACGARRDDDRGGAAGDAARGGPRRRGPRAGGERARAGGPRRGGRPGGDRGVGRRIVGVLVAAGGCRCGGARRSARSQPCRQCARSPRRRPRRPAAIPGRPGPARRRPWRRGARRPGARRRGVWWTPCSVRAGRASARPLPDDPPPLDDWDAIERGHDPTASRPTGGRARCDLPSYRPRGAAAGGPRSPRPGPRQGGIPSAGDGCRGNGDNDAACPPRRPSYARMTSLAVDVRHAQPGPIAGATTDRQGFGAAMRGHVRSRWVGRASAPMAAEPEEPAL